MSDVDGDVVTDVVTDVMTDVVTDVVAMEDAGSTVPAGATGCGRPGRPRSEDADRAILAAAIDALVEEGFATMTIEGVAARARVGKATIYRRWPCKLDLVLEAVNRRILAKRPLPDTGDIRADVATMIDELCRTLSGPEGRVALALVAEQLRHPQLSAGFQHQFVAERRAAMRAMVERAIAKGQLPAETDAELLADVGAALLWQRIVVTGTPLDDDLPRRIVAQFFPAV